MQSCSIHHCVLLFLTLTFTTGPTIAYKSVKVKLHQSATLPCNFKCSGLVRWTRIHAQDVVLAECNQTSCRSVKGYEMAHDQYLKGNVSLIITATDYKKRGLYIIDCDGTDIRDVCLIIEPLMLSVQLNPSEDLVMDLPIPEPVEVVYKPSDSTDLYGQQICTVTQKSLQCKDEYIQRASLSSTNITLRNVKLNDSGTYSVRDTDNDDIIHIYTLFVKEVQAESERKMESGWVWRILLPVIIIGIIIGGVVVATKFVKKTRHIKHLEQEKAQLEETIKLKPVTEPEETRRRANSDVQVLLREMVAVDKLIQQYNDESMVSQTWPSLNIPVLEILKRNKAQMEEVVQNRGSSMQDPFCQWWSMKRPELDKIIERWRKFDEEPHQPLQKEQYSSSQDKI